MSKTVKRLLKNFFSLTVSDILSKVFEFLYVIIVGRYLGVEGFGIITYWLAYTVIINFTANLGFGQLMVREVSRDNSQAKKYFGNNFTLSSILVLVISLVTTLILFLIDIDSILQICGFIILSSLIVQTIIAGSFYSMFRSFEKMGYQGVGLIINSLMKFILALIAVNKNFTIINLSLMHLTSYLITLIYCIIISIVIFIKPRFSFDFRFIKSSLKQSIPFGLTGTLFQIYDWIEVFLLLLFFSETIVGFYNGALKLVQPLTVFSLVLAISIFPILSRSYITSKENYKNLIIKFLKFSTLIAVPISILVFIFADPIISIVYGTGFEGSVAPLKILSWIIIPYYIRVSLSRIMESSNKQSLLVKVAGLCLIINVILNFLLIYYFSYIGASIAKLITITLSVILLVIALYKKEKALILKEMFVNFLKTMIAGIIILIAGLILNYVLSDLNIIFNLIISSVVVLLLYIIILIVFRVVKKSEIMSIKQMIIQKDTENV